MDQTALPAEIAAMSFEDALKALEDIVRQLESGQIRLEEAVNAYEKGDQLRLHCERRLNEAKAKIDKITVDADGAVAVAPFNPA